MLIKVFSAFCRHTPEELVAKYDLKIEKKDVD